MGCRPPEKPSTPETRTAITNAQASLHQEKPAPEAAAGEATQADGTTRLQEHASKALEDGDFALAVRHLESLVALKPEDEESFFNLGYAQSRIQQTNEAIRSYERCLKLLPEYAEAHNNLGNLLMAQRRFDEASLHFRTAIIHQPENAAAHNNLGKAMALQSKLKDALPFFREAIRLDPKHWDARHNLAVTYLNFGMLEESRAELKSLVEENPDMVIARKTLSRVDSLLPKQTSPAQPR